MLFLIKNYLASIVQELRNAVKHNDQDYFNEVLNELTNEDLQLVFCDPQLMNAACEYNKN